MPRHPRFSSHDPLLDARPAATLDLHGHTRDSARAAVERFIKTPGRSGRVVHVITGRGKGSAGAPVLKTLVRGLLKSALAPYVREWALDDGDGGYRILIR